MKFTKVAQGDDGVHLENSKTSALTKRSAAVKMLSCHVVKFSVLHVHVIWNEVYYTCPFSFRKYSFLEQQNIETKALECGLYIADSYRHDSHATTMHYDRGS